MDNAILDPVNTEPKKANRMDILDFDFDSEDSSTINTIYKVKKNYESFWKKNESGEFGEMSIDLIRAVKRTIFGTSKTKNDAEPLQDLVLTLRFIVEKMCGLTPEEFDSVYSTRTNKKIHVENLTRKISEMVSDDVKEKCFFEQKRIIFATVYPEYYKQKFADFKAEDIFNAKGDLKGALVRAARICNPDAGVDTSLENNDGSFKKVNIRNGVKKTYGKFVDKIIFNAIDEVLENSLKEDEDELRDDGFLKDSTYKKMEYLASSKNYKSPDKTKYGCFAIIDERGCYACYLDFYFLNMPPEKQLEYVDDFMYIREKAKIQKEPMLDMLYDIYKENQKQIEDCIINGYGREAY